MEKGEEKGEGGREKGGSSRKGYLKGRLETGKPQGKRVRWQRGKVEIGLQEEAGCLFSSKKGENE